MSDIRVYWDDTVDMYTVIIDGFWLLQCGDDDDDDQSVCTQCFLDNEDRLVYEYTEDSDEWGLSLIDENLRIPSLAEIDELNGNCNSLVRQVFPDYESWCYFWVVADKQRLYHKERTA